MTTVPGFSSRTTSTTVRQFPARDGAQVTDIAGMETPGWSNSNGEDAPEADSKVVTPETVEDKAVAKKTTARKTAQKKG